MRKLSEGLFNNIQSRVKSLHKKKNEIWLKSRLNELSFDDFIKVFYDFYVLEFVKYSKDDSKYTIICLGVLERHIVNQLKEQDFVKLEQCIDLCFKIRNVSFVLQKTLEHGFYQYIGLLKDKYSPRGVVGFDAWCFNMLLQMDMDICSMLECCSYIDMYKVDLPRSLERIYNVSKYGKLLCFNLNKRSIDYLLDKMFVLEEGV